MNVSVNDRSVEIENQTNLHALISQLKLPSATGIAVAVNNQIVKKGHWENHLLAENDQVLIIKASQGG
ncbi:sulfur carrier protein ThiS [Sunxiuqinia indica]|uniref:sulfur carrier protein ThiS n=1 Tax=Sunxiuqinia indica TaxID=2692584 RepID=UPI001357D05E|nr:sulfur carrier protein ThiS [Sunxiuqinia indica]